MRSWMRAYSSNCRETERVRASVSADGVPAFDTNQVDNTVNVPNPTELSALKSVTPFGEVDPDYPLNPNGSLRAVAGICDPTGRIFGLMPHPEAYLHRTNHPRWTREDLPEEGAGLQMFKNAVTFAAKEFA